LASNAPVQMKTALRNLQLKFYYIAESL